MIVVSYYNQRPEMSQLFSIYHSLIIYIRSLIYFIRRRILKCHITDYYTADILDESLLKVNVIVLQAHPKLIC